MPVVLTVEGGTIHNVLIIAEMQTFGSCLAAVLRHHGYHVTIVETDKVFQYLTRIRFDLVIATNTSISPPQLRSIVPDIKTRYPHARIIALSGYCPDDFVADLKFAGVDGFLPLPFEQDALLKRIAALLTGPALTTEELIPHKPHVILN